MQLLSEGKWHAWLDEGHIGKRVFIAFIFWIALAVFLQFRQTPVQNLDLNSKSDKYVIAQAPFNFPDENATHILKQQAAKEIGPIYKIDEHLVQERRLECENELVHNEKWRTELPQTSFGEIYHELERVTTLLFKSRFTDGKTYQKMGSLQLSTGDTFIFSVHDPSKFEQLPESFWTQMDQAVGSSQAAAYIVRYFSSRSWFFQEDLIQERTVRQAVENAVPQKYTRIDAGQILIAPGEQVTTRHLAMIKAMENQLGKAKKHWTLAPILGSLLLSFIITALCVIYLRINHRDILKSVRKLTLLISIVILILYLSKVAEYFFINRSPQLIDFVRYPLFVPLASIVICALIGAQAALFTSGVLVVVLAISLAVDYDRFLVVNLIAALVAIISARKMHKRKEVFGVCAKVWIACVPVIVAFNLLSNDLWYLNLAADLISTLIFMSFTAILAVGLLPLLESAFQVMTEMSLMEHLDPNNNLLRRLSIEAPGTYQHSLVVGNLAELAARAIGADGLFCRVSSLYHDVGKLSNPHYFTENQLGGFNIHQLLTPAESAQVIIAHVAEGESLARKYKLPKSFIHIIKEHHGTTYVYYFYRKELEKMEGDPSKIDDKKFRYSGPKPHTKESAIIMLADIVEAASRSIDEFSEETISELIDTLVREKINDGQLDDSQLTFAELGVIKRTLAKTLLVSSHARVKYPAKI